MPNKFYQGVFTPKNPNKCINIAKGKPPFARSSWETRAFNWCDTNANVIKWASELVKVPYIYEIDQRLHNYFPDLYVEIIDKQGKLKKYLIEIKPDKQTSKPNPPKNKTKKALFNYNKALREWVKNQNKWKHAGMFCEGKDWVFRVVTERDLF